MNGATMDGPGVVKQRPVAPETKLGWWSIGFMVVAGLCMVLNGPLLMSGLVSLTPVGGVIYVLVLVGSALVAAALSLIAMLRLHDRAWLLFFPLVPGVLVLVFLIGEFGAAALGLGH